LDREASDRFHSAFFGCLYYACMRPGEAVLLQREHLRPDLAAGTAEGAHLGTQHRRVRQDRPMPVSVVVRIGGQSVSADPAAALDTDS
jgi:hypothetical protein